MHILHLHLPAQLLPNLPALTIIPTSNPLATILPLNPRHIPPKLLQNHNHIHSQQLPQTPQPICVPLRVVPDNPDAPDHHAPQQPINPQPADHVPSDPEVAVPLDEAVAREGEEARLEDFRHRAQVGMRFSRGGPAVQEVEDAVGGLEEGDEGEGDAACEFGEALSVHCGLCSRPDWGLPLRSWWAVGTYEMVGRSPRVVSQRFRGGEPSAHTCEGAKPLTQQAECL